MAEVAIGLRSTGPRSTGPQSTAPQSTAPQSAAPRLPGPVRVTAGQVRYQLTLLMRTPRALLAGLLLPGALLALQLGKVQHLGSHAATEALLAARVSGLIVLGTMSIAYLTHASGLVTAREQGVLRRWRATPLPSWGYFAGRIIATVLVAEAAGLILLLVGVAMAGLHLTAGAIIGLLIAGTLGALALAAAGTAITPLITSAQGANPLLTLTYIPLIIFSGGFGGVSGLPSWLNTVMSYLPAQPMIDAATRALAGTGGGVHLMTGHDLAVLAGWAVGGLLVSMRFFQWDPHRAAHARHLAAGTEARSA
jgi:ABC-2 type transport system permease protein